MATVENGEVLTHYEWSGSGDGEVLVFANSLGSDCTCGIGTSLAGESLVGFCDTTCGVTESQRSAGPLHGRAARRRSALSPRSSRARQREPLRPFARRLGCDVDWNPCASAGRQDDSCQYGCEIRSAREIGTKDRNGRRVRAWSR